MLAVALVMQGVLQSWGRLTKSDGFFCGSTSKKFCCSKSSSKKEE